MKRDRVFLMGVAALLFWVADAYSKIVFLHAPYQVLWYSSMGLLCTSIGLLTKNKFLLVTMFCALFPIELAWDISFLSHIVLQRELGITSYAFTQNYSRGEFIMTMYHIILVPAILMGVSQVKN